MIMKTISLGQPFDFFSNSADIKQGAVLEMLPGGGFIYVIHIPMITTDEVYALNTERIQMKVLQEGPYLLTLFSFGHGFIQEASFDPTIYKDGRISNLLKNNMLHIVGVESTSNIVCAQRLISVPMVLYGTWIAAWGEAKIIPGYSQKYNRWMQDLYERYSTRQLWEFAKHSCFSGE